MQFQQPFPPNPQLNQEPYGQPEQQQLEAPKPVNAVKSVFMVCGILAIIIVAILGFLAINGNKGSTASSTLSEPYYKAKTVDTTVAFLDKESNQGKGVD